MTQQLTLARGAAIFSEMEEFAGFSIDAQNYIRKSLGIASARSTMVECATEAPNKSSTSQGQMYRSLDPMRAQLAGRRSMSDSAFLALLIELTRFDLDGGELDGFAPYRFLYERLLGGRARRWLPGAFGAVVLVAHIKATHRITLLGSLEDAVATRWSEKEPSFYPERIDC